MLFRSISGARNRVAQNKYADLKSERTGGGDPMYDPIEAVNLAYDHVMRIESRYWQFKSQTDKEQQDEIDKQFKATYGYLPQPARTPATANVPPSAFRPGPAIPNQLPGPTMPNQLRPSH